MTRAGRTALAPVLVLADEPAQWPDTTGERMVAALRTAAGKQPHSRFVALGTRPADAGHWFAKMLSGGASYAQNHTANAGDPKFQRRTWSKANPSLPAMPDLLAAIRNEAIQAKADPALLASFEALRLNLGTDDVAVTTLLSAGLWQDIEGEAVPGGACVWGVDLGTSAAQSAVAAYWPETGRLECVAAFPHEPSLAERGLRDGVGGLYAECAKRGDLIQVGGRTVDIEMLLRAALERFGRPARVVADRWREAELRDTLEAAGVPMAAFEARGMGFRDGAEDIRGLSPGLRRWPRDSCHEPVVAQRDGRSAHRERPGWQCEAIERITGRAAGTCPRRRGGGGDPSRCGGRSAAYGAAETVAL